MIETELLALQAEVFETILELTQDEAEARRAAEAQRSVYALLDFARDWDVGVDEYRYDVLPVLCA
jgi:hypothetical protein